jgi:rare lipoprotein A (peptidoglycan hydrolase)
LTSKRTIRAIAGFACAAALLVAAPIASAQTGGVPGGTSSDPTASTSSPGSYTVHQGATWYGGKTMWGRSTACGLTLAPTTIGVANKTLPCGTQVTFSYAGRSITTTVIDRGPYHKGYAWDLTKKAAKRLGFLAVGAGRVDATITPSS